MQCFSSSSPEDYLWENTRQLWLIFHWICMCSNQYSLAWYLERSIGQSARCRRKALDSGPPSERLVSLDSKVLWGLVFSSEMVEKASTTGGTLHVLLWSAGWKALCLVTSQCYYPSWAAVSGAGSEHGYAQCSGVEEQEQMDTHLGVFSINTSSCMGHDVSKQWLWPSQKCDAFLFGSGGNNTTADSARLHTVCLYLGADQRAWSSLFDLFDKHEGFLLFPWQMKKWSWLGPQSLLECQRLISRLLLTCCGHIKDLK